MNEMISPSCPCGTETHNILAENGVQCAGVQCRVGEVGGGAGMIFTMIVCVLVVATRVAS
jgi:hypothetical protein